MTAINETSPHSDVESARFLASAYERLQDELSKIIVGQQRVIEELLIAIFSRGHCLMQGVPGLAKTLLDRKSTRLNSSHSQISYAVFCLKKKKNASHLGTSHSSQTG